MVQGAGNSLGLHSEEGCNLCVWPALHRNCWNSSTSSPTAATDHPLEGGESYLRNKCRMFILKYLFLSLCAPPYQHRWCWSIAASGCPVPDSGAVGLLEGRFSACSWSLYHKKCCRDSMDPKSSSFYSPLHQWGLQAVLVRNLGSLPHHYTPK